MNARQEFCAAIAAAGLTLPDSISCGGRTYSAFDFPTGKLCRFSTNGKRGDDAGWLIFHDDERPAGRFGCNRSGIDISWRADVKREFTPEERKAWAERMRALEAEREQVRQEALATAADKASKMWEAASDASERAHGYLARKQIPGIGARILRDMLLIPMRQKAGALCGLQIIQPDGSRKFLTGTPAGGAYTVLGKPSRTGTVVICEGYATGVSIHQATGFCTVVAFSAGNLAAVADKIARAMPDAHLVIGADDDFQTDGNPGMTAAAATGLPVAIPLWAGDRGRGTDFNDLHLAEGLDAVRACFEDPQPIRPLDDDALDEEIFGAEPIAPAADSGVPAVAEASASAELLPAVTDEWAPNCSDDDLAARHLQRMQQLTLWCEVWGRWLIWNGDRWIKDESLAVQDQVRQTLRHIANEVQNDQSIKPDKRARQADKISSFKSVQNVERMARTYRQVATHPDEWDADLWALNTPGGVVDLRTGDVRPHTVADRFTKITAVAPGGECPTWLQFLDRATGGDKQLQGFLKRMCGYALTGEVREHALFFVYGTGGNGKGTFLNTITHIMGDYQRVSGAETFTESPGDRHTTELARLQGSRLVTAQETEEGKRWAESRIKSLTGGDPITARFMRQDDFTYIPQFKLVIVGNHKPSFRSVDEAIRRRLHLIPFTASIPAAERDPLLPQKLKAEAGAILSWMIEGCREWAIHGLQPPQIVKESTDHYLGAEDSLQQWLDECCEVGTGFASSKALFSSWARWCEESGEFVGTMKRLMAKLESRGISTGQKFKGQRGCLGIMLKNEESNPF
jgi:P4 family phage/plasmid primase-like protien